jgi:hypothetical protein
MSKQCFPLIVLYSGSTPVGGVKVRLLCSQKDLEKAQYSQNTPFIATQAASIDL